MNAESIGVLCARPNNTVRFLCKSPDLLTKPGHVPEILPNTVAFLISNNRIRPCKYAQSKSGTGKKQYGGIIFRNKIVRRFAGRHQRGAGPDSTAIILSGKKPVVS